MTARSFIRIVPAQAAVLLAAAGIAACSSGLAVPPDGARRGPGGELIVRKGRFEGRFLLTGELEAVRAEQLVVPRIPNWQTTIRWMEAEGALVKAGQRLIEFDTSSFASDYGEKLLARDQAESDLEEAQAQSASDMTEKAFQAEQKRIAVDKAKIAAAIPAEFLRGKDWDTNQMTLKRAETELQKAQEDREAADASGKETVKQKSIALDKAERELAASRQAMNGMILTAPRDGIFVVGEHPWEGRKFQIGDSVWVGLTVGSLPDLSRMRVVGKLSDVDDGRVAAGMPVVCTLDAYPDASFRGRIDDVMAVAQEQARRSLRRAYDVRIGLESSDPTRMRPGMSVKIEVVPPARDGVLLVPREALVWRKGQALARTTSGREVEVKVGPCNADVCIVESGLTEGERLGGGA